ncbi:MAG TPA: NUDIX hydrolase [Candidatus Microsaccharimonas sp.]|nr:NUDIX hydrolase [Candidatus Microsaccharimonas sp.]
MADLTPQNLPDAFYRAAVKVLIIDELGRLLVTQNQDSLWEVPGGGWEHHETLLECVAREMDEELGVKVENISDIEFVLRGESERGWHVLRLAVRATLSDDAVLTPGDDQVAFRFVNRRDFLQLEFCAADKPFQDATEKIWTD